MLLPIAVNAQTHWPKKFKLPANINEASGLYIASPDSLWWHNDSGDAPRLILTDHKGKVKKEVLIPGIRNVDWEEITADHAGNLYIGDFGNNQNRRRDLRIYIYQPNTGKIDSIAFDYPDQKLFPPPPAQANFDMEGFFWHADSLHLFSKNRMNAGDYYSKHYVLPARAGNYTAQLRDSIYLNNRVVTAAAMSPDGQRVALLAYNFKRILGFIPNTHTAIWWLEAFPGTDYLKGAFTEQKVYHCFSLRQYEALDFINNNQVLIGTERISLFKQKAKRVSIKKKKIRP